MQILRRMFERLGRGGEHPEALYEVLDDDVVWDTTGRQPDGRVFRGHDGVRQFWRTWRGTWDAWEFRPEEIVDVGDSVVVSMYQRGRGKGSGVEVEDRHGQIWTFRGPKVIRHAQYRTLEEALEAARRSEANVEIVRRHIEAFGRDATTALSFLDPYVVWDTSRTGGADPAYGHGGVARAARRYLGAFEEYTFDADRLSDLGSGWVLAAVTESGRGKGSGVPAQRTFAALYTLLDGRIARITTFPGWDEALHAVARPE